MKIGFIGLGNLGTPIAANILEKTKQLYVYNRTASKALPLIEKGAVQCASVKELASLCDIVCSIVADDAALNHLTKDEDGIAANLKAGGIHISISTILPATSTELFALHKAHNNHYVACPVLGRPEAAAARKLNFLVSGEAAIIEIIKPLLTDAGAAGTWEFGNEVGNANVAKLCSNFLIVSAIEAMSEAINLANKSDIDTTKWFQMITQTLFTTPIYLNYGKLVLQQQFEAGFALKLGLKDVNLMLGQAHEVAAKMPTADLLKKQMDQCIIDGHGDKDWTAVSLALQ
jgi:3-hydroxyisobutyrate dehydrogenase-like beta-hydroxyacid dehydrogenase